MSLSIAALSTGAAARPAAAGAAVSAASLQGQLQRYQQQLSDCVNCSSAKTPQGKATIDTLAAKISQIERRIDKLGQDGGTPAPAALPPTASGAGIDVYA